MAPLPQLLPVVPRDDDPLADCQAELIVYQRSQIVWYVVTGLLGSMTLLLAILRECARRETSKAEARYRAIKILHDKASSEANYFSHLLQWWQADHDRKRDILQRQLGQGPPASQYEYHPAGKPGPPKHFPEESQSDDPMHRNPFVVGDDSDDDDQEDNPPPRPARSGPATTVSTGTSSTRAQQMMTPGTSRSGSRAGFRRGKRFPVIPLERHRRAALALRCTSAGVSRDRDITPTRQRDLTPNTARASSSPVAALSPLSTVHVVDETDCIVDSNEDVPDANENVASRYARSLAEADAEFETFSGVHAPTPGLRQAVVAVPAASAAATSSRGGSSVQPSHRVSKAPAVSNREASTSDQHYVSPSSDDELPTIAVRRRSGQ